MARLICDVHNPDGTAFAGDPRGVLKRVLERAEAMGFTCNVGAELEFFLFQTDEGRPPHHSDLRRGPATSTWAPWTTGRAPAGRSA